jgi:cytochrome c biogenesis protein CcdA
MLFSLLALGLVLGLKHALEADHLSTVATLASRSSSTRQMVGVATAWGLGHAATLVVLGSVLLVVGAALPQGVVRGFEAAVGLVLVALGIDVLRRLRRQRMHVHVHEHQGERHLHVHAHASGRDSHDHLHAPLLGRSLIVGGVHGLAGSAAVTVLALPAGSLARGVSCLLVFGAGTVLGMIALTLVVSLPMRWSFEREGRAAFVLKCSLSALDLGLGTWIVVQSAVT